MDVDWMEINFACLFTLADTFRGHDVPHSHVVLNCRFVRYIFSSI